MTTKALAATCWLAALIATAAAATQHQTAMGIAGLVGVVAAIAWGLVRTFGDEPVDYSPFGADGYLKSDEELASLGFYRCGFIEDEGELPYRAPIRTENIYRGPVWPNEIGAPE